MTNFDQYLASGDFIDSADADVRAFAEAYAAGAADELARAVQLYYAVRDGIFYDPYYTGAAPRFFRASDCLRARRGFCIPKAALLAAAARVVKIPTRVGYADVRNHLVTKRLRELIGGSDLIIWHGFTELYLEGRWVKATPAFNRSLCERFGVVPLEFDGRQDSLFHPYDRAGRLHMEYVSQRGSFADVPFQTLVSELGRVYPRWMALGADDVADRFAREAAAERELPAD